MVYVWEFHLAPNALHLTVKEVRAIRILINISRPDTFAPEGVIRLSEGDE